MEKESNWRWNVWEFGWSSTGARLAARLLTNPAWAVIADADPNSPFYTLALNVGGDLGWTEVFRPAKLLAFPHFPYGNVVEAD